jgi:hypothetical protein
MPQQRGSPSQCGDDFSMVGLVYWRDERVPMMLLDSPPIDADLGMYNE